MAEQISFTLNKGYALSATDKPVVLDLLFGDVGQSVDVTVRLGNKAFDIPGDESVKKLIIGNSSALDGKTLRIAGNIADGRESDKSTVTLKLSGGDAVLTKKFSTTVEEGEVVLVSFVIRFFA
jgi:hypothetical protein